MGRTGSYVLHQWEKIGAILDRNGLRPSRYVQTDDGMILLSSEMGVLDIDPKAVVKRWRLEPGKIFLIDLIEKRVIDNEEIKSKLSSKYDYIFKLKVLDFYQGKELTF